MRLAVDIHHINFADVCNGGVGTWGIWLDADKEEGGPFCHIFVTSFMDE